MANHARWFAQGKGVVFSKGLVYSAYFTVASVGRTKLMVDYAFEYSYNLTFPCAASLHAILPFLAEGAFHLHVFVA